MATPPTGQELAGAAAAVANVEMNAEPDTEGHPNCTCAEECIGSPHDSLVQHLVESGEDQHCLGDIYCSSCWQSFFEREPALQGTRMEQ